MEPLKQPLSRKYSPHLSETSSNSRSDSPVSAASDNQTTETQDSGISFPHDNQNNSEMGPPPPGPPPPYKTVYHTSPKPERKTYSREQDEIRNESKIKKY